ncbi:MAG: thiamine diphosphokinase [Actinobacteria bacterium]|jgi:thiamine pyrophosphokinase|nr:thiamine diphosphokinase [Actinomycetota bacterium]
MIKKEINKNKTEVIKKSKKREDWKGGPGNSSKVIIVANGFIRDPSGTYKKMTGHFGFSKDDIVVCADGGASNALKMGLVPDVVIGDMDSIKFGVKEKIREKSTKTRYISTSSQKDESDTQLAVEYALGMDVKKIIITGAVGDRIDHTLANIILLSSPKLEDIDARILTDNSDIFIVRKPVTIFGVPGKTITLISLSPYTYFTGTRGLKYELKEEKLDFSPVRGLSNEFIDKKAKLDIREGTLLVIREL